MSLPLTPKREGGVLNPKKEVTNDGLAASQSALRVVDERD